MVYIQKRLKPLNTVKKEAEAVDYEYCYHIVVPYLHI